MKTNNNNNSNSNNNDNEKRECRQECLTEQRKCKAGAQGTGEGRAKTQRKKIKMNEVILQIANAKGKLRLIFISALRTPRG